MFSTEQWSEPAVRIWTIASRFQKFIVVGAVGLAVNQGMLFLLHDFTDLVLSFASPIAIFISMIVTFTLNERWTWHDRGTGALIHRLLMYFPINSGGLVINFALLTILHNRYGVHYLMANLVGAGVAAVWNFGLNNAITWRK